MEPSVTGKTNLMPQPKVFAHAAFCGQFGVARVDITPPVGVYARNWGAAKHDVAESIHRPLNLTAMVLSESADSYPLVLLDADLGWWKTPQTFRSFQTSLLERLQLLPSQLLFALSHTHAGPPLMEVDPSLPGSEPLQAWMDGLLDLAVTVVREALDARQPASLEWHVGKCELANVRDLRDPEDGSDRYLCGFDPEGNPDDTLLVGRVTDPAGKSLATLVNYACHPTTLAAENRAISPDYVGAMRETIQDVTGAPALFLLGACGELAPRYQYVGDPEVADRHGRQLGFAALATLSDMEPPATELAFAETLESGAPLAIWKHRSRTPATKLRVIQRSVELPLKDWPSAEELEDQRVACTDRALEERLRRRRDIRRSVGNGSVFSLPIYCWQFGDAVLVGCCCEPYSCLQQELRKRFQGTTVVVMNLVNGSLGYLPPAPLYDQDIYPVWQTPFERGSLELVIQAMTGVVEDVLSQ